MKKVLIVISVLLFGMFGIAGNAFSLNLTNLQGVLDSHTAPYPGTSSVNVWTDNLDDSIDSYWSVDASGGAVSTMIIELAAYANDNTFGVYDAANSGNMVQMFTGPEGAGTQKLLSIYADGSVYVNFVDTGIDFAGNTFGFYLTSPTQPTPLGTGATYFSDTGLNADAYDHMLAYQGVGDTFQILPFAEGAWSEGEYILAWEDLWAGGDEDFTDFVVMVESITPVVPEPSTLLLLGSGLIGLAYLKRRKS